MGDPGFVEFPVWLIITQETLKAEYRHYSAKLLGYGYNKKFYKLEAERERQWTFFIIIFPGSIWTGWANLISFLVLYIFSFVC